MRTLIKALSLINTDYDCIVVGDGEDKKFNMRLSKKLNIDKISFVGFIEDTDEYYSKFDCLVVPSKRESFGISVIEAQYNGVPVIAANIMGLKEIIKNKKNG